MKQTAVSFVCMQLPATHHCQSRTMNFSAASNCTTGQSAQQAIATLGPQGERKYLGSKRAGLSAGEYRYLRRYNVELLSS